MDKTVVVEKDGIKKTVQEEYKSDYIVAGWKEATATPTASTNVYTYPNTMGSKI